MTIQYIVQSSPNAAGPWTPVAGSPFTTLTDTISGLTPGTSLFFQFQAQDTVYNITGPATVIGPITAGTGALTESPQGTRLTNTTGQIVDAALGVWVLISIASPVTTLTVGTVTTTTVVLSWAAPAATLLQIHHPNGTTDGNNVTQLLYWNHTVYRLDNAGWASWNGTTWVAASGDPSVGGGFTESTQGTTVADTSGTITDATGGTWQLAGTTNLQVSHNGVIDTNTSNIILLLYWNHQVYRENNVQQWWFWNGSGWVVSTDPRVTVSNESPDGTTVANTTDKIIDSTTAVWSLVDSSAQGLGFQIARNGTVDGTTQQVTMLLYYQHVVYHNSPNGNALGTPGWWSWTGNAWNPVSGDPRPPAVTWSLSDKSTTITLSNNNLTATTSAAGGSTGTGTYATPGSGSINFNGAIWSIDLNGNILVNGGALNGGSGTSAIDLFNNTMYGQDSSSGQWFTWDGANFNPSAAPGNLPGSGPPPTQSIRSSAGRTTGKYFFEITGTTIKAGFSFGISTGTYNLSAQNGLGGDPTGVGYFCTNQQVFNGTTTPVSQGSSTDVNGAIMSCAIDLDAKLVWFTSPAMRTTLGAAAWNNSLSSNPVNSTGGISFASIGAGPYYITFSDKASGGLVSTANFGGSAFNQTQPSGYSSWGTGTVIPPPVNNATFNDDFNTLSLWNSRNTAAGGTWQPSFWYATDGMIQNSCWILNPFNPATPIPIANVYSASGGLARLNVIQTPSNLISACGGQAYVGNTIHTSHSFRQLYGYFEARFAISNVIGAYPSFVLMNDIGWPPELDVIEIVNTGSWIGKVSIWDMNQQIVASKYTYDSGSPFSGGFDPTVMHTYALDWQANTITAYWDRIQVLQAPTPAGYTTPLFPYLQLVAGDGSWGSPIQNPSQLPATLTIDYVRVWPTRPF